MNPTERAQRLQTIADAVLRRLIETSVPDDSEVDDHDQNDHEEEEVC